MLTDGRTDNGRKVITIAHPEQSSGELIIKQYFGSLFFLKKDKFKRCKTFLNEIIFEGVV